MELLLNNTVTNGETFLSRNSNVTINNGNFISNSSKTSSGVAITNNTPDNVYKQ